ncbi:response regulator [Orrella marina]|uniref:DNA-binding response regulator n=1 Tax=Orrella marina TaxID=2163011 RepID=A0A2R4XMQ8_9BURK|nr:response regulator [Orrella marina]AWB35092.1 DNA-binding response regulator [Orrella marina]
MSDHPEHILIVDDDREIRRLLQEYLTQSGYRVTDVGEGRAMRKALDEYQIDLVVLDLMLPGEDGLSLCRTLRIRSNIPVLMLTARGSEVDRIVGLEMGADDYLAKPFSPRELLARIRSVLRRAKSLPLQSVDPDVSAYRFGGWSLDVVTRNMTAADGLVVPLSGAEFRLLRVFLEHPNVVLSRDQLLELVSGRESMPFDRSVDVLIGRLRRRLNDAGKEPALIKTIRGQGYVLATRVESE